MSHDIIERFKPLFEPKTVAVVGASARGVALPNIFIRRIREFGYAGAIYPIHPSAPEIDGLKAYRTLGATPNPVDYAYIAIGAAQVPPLLREAGGRVRFVQVISSGFGEVEEGKALQEDLAAAARAGGMRLIGPNCLGLYSPRGRITFAEIAPEKTASSASSRRAEASAPISSSAAAPGGSSFRGSSPWATAPTSA
jgi:acyl-CoA synthetase (NDP forming)